MEFNVNFISKDWKKSWNAKELTEMIQSMPHSNVINEVDHGTCDEDIMISCPESMAPFLNGNDGLGINIFEYSYYEYGGLYWDGKLLWVFYQSVKYSFEEWKKKSEKDMEEEDG